MRWKIAKLVYAKSSTTEIFENVAFSTNLSWKNEAVEKDLCNEKSSYWHNIPLHEETFML